MGGILDDLLRDLGGTRCHRLLVERLHRIFLVVIVTDELRAPSANPPYALLAELRGFVALFAMTWIIRTSAISRREAPEVLQFDGPRKAKRAQGKPGARCTRGLVCKMHIGKRTRAYRFSGGIRLSLRDGLRLISCSPR
jgi:hypothetical protein